ncbi:MAG: anthranilate phosphoribosyltransferase [Terriglobales bacterium]
MTGTALQKLLERRDLTREEARDLLAHAFTGSVTEAELAGILIALKMKGEAVEELVGFAQAMRAAVSDIGLGNGAVPVPCVDTCGTGGSARQIFNVSTAAAIVAAGAGAPVAKHGNRSNSSVCGSADVFEALGVNLEYPASALGECLRQVGLVFLYAPLLHGSMRHVGPVRKALKVRTVFNLLGPLTNPAGATAQVVGVSAMELIPVMAEALLRLGTRHSFVVRSEDGLGEFSTTGSNRVAEIHDGRVRQYRLAARDVGLEPAALPDLACDSKAEAIAMVQAVLDGQRGAPRDIVCFNAAATLIAHGSAADWKSGLEQARRAIDSGAARAKLNALAAYTSGEMRGAGPQ